MTHEPIYICKQLSDGKCTNWTTFLNHSDILRAVQYLMDSIRPLSALDDFFIYALPENGDTWEIISFHNFAEAAGIRPRTFAERMG